MSYDPRDVERKWQDRWAEEGRYEVDPSDDEEATFVTVPYPYPSGGMHIGHARTYTVPDVYARYRRLQGDNVLFPIAWHVTGTPIIGAVERLKNGEAEQLSVLRDTYGVPEETLDELETPMGFARYFVEEHYKKNMQALGLSIDWRREFTTNDERYSKFVTWQYETLRERGLLEKGLHPVKYCTRERNPVTTHDLLEGEEAEFQEYTLVKFEDEEGVVYPMATLRPETVRGVTNAFVNPDATYVQATVDGNSWIVSVEAAAKLELQAREVAVEAEFSGSELVGGRVENPVTGEDILLLPASFVDPDNATGVVMSVPAHSPDDYVALREVRADADELAEYGIDPEAVRAIEPRPILDVEGYGEIPARDAVEAAGIEDSDDPDLHEVTADLYQAEFHKGRLREEYGEYAGRVVEEVRDELKDDYQSRGASGAMYAFSEEVVCRCGGDVEVAEQETWFLRYDDADWKAKAHDAVAQLDAIPENTREQYDHTIDWLNEWPAIRNYGLGTRLPWDEEFVIEPLSDSTIYMAYYTVAHRLRDVPVEELDREFFDTLFYGSEGREAEAERSSDANGVSANEESRGSEGERSESSGEAVSEAVEDGEVPRTSEDSSGDEPRDPDQTALDLHEEWEYWYPVDYRCSGNDLISNHLTFYLFHHAELFAEPEWPRGITVMGMGLLEGEKMSSSKGHVVLPSAAIEEYGADTVRFFLLNAAEPWQDYDWRGEQVQSTRDQLARFWNRANDVIDEGTVDTGERELEHVDRWLLSKLQSTVRTATDAMERFETRTASRAVFYDFAEHLKWYRKRADLDRPGARWTLCEVLRTRLRLLEPFVPFLTNELYERLAGTPVEDAQWPEPTPEFESVPTEVEESLVKDLTADVRDIVGVTDSDPDTVRVYVAADWKRKVLSEVVETGPDVGAVMGRVMQYDGLRERGDAVNDLVQELVAVVRELPDEEVEVLPDADERAVYEDAQRFLEGEFDADVEIYEEGEDAYDPADKAGNAVPLRPAIHLE